MPSWSDISLFLAVMREGSAAGAARVLHTNQTTVSRRIERLERALGLKLFEKGPRGAQPTDNARALLPDAERMAQAAEGLSNRAESLKRHIAGTIRLSCNALAARHGIARVLHAFQDAHPDVSFDLDTEDRIVSLEKGEADVAIRSGNLTDETDSLIARKLMDHPWGFYASEAYIQARGLPQTFEEMQGHDVILLSDAEFVDCVRKAQGRLPEGKRGLRTNSLTAMVGLLAADEGVGFLPRAAGDPEPTLRFCFTEPDLVQPLWLVTSQEAYATPLIRTFMGFLNQSGVDPFAHIPENWRN